MTTISGTGLLALDECPVVEASDLVTVVKAGNGEYGNVDLCGLFRTQHDVLPPGSQGWMLEELQHRLEKVWIIPVPLAQGFDVGAHPADPIEFRGWVKVVRRPL